MFNFSITNRKKLVFVLLLGLSSCQKAKNNSFSGGENGDSMKNSSQNRPEIKVSVTKKDREGKNISLLPHLSLNWDQLLASDTLQFKLDIQTREAEVKMNWTTNCQFGAENKTQQGSFQLPIEMKVSQFLPHSFFFNPQHPYGKDIPCSFSFSAKQEATGARHEFSYKAPLYLDHSGQIHIEELYSRNYLSDQVELKELQLEVFNQLRIIFPLDHRLDLECSRFRSPLIIEKNLSPVVGTPIWIDEKVESRLPMQEFPLQICRIIGKKEGLIASWSPYFILKSKTKGLSFSWTSSPSVKKYTIGDPLPTIDLGTLSFKNDQSYPQSLRIPKYADFDILPLCFIGVKVRPAPLVRRVPGRLSSQEGLKILSQDNQAWVIKLSPLAQSQVIYESSVNL
ncbi:MAG: hypothetical protein KDD35_01350, partial [Bdellovibrionales bacterium]|nr:hypothetical protein [Bdellovibrionales bacterium]